MNDTGAVALAGKGLRVLAIAHRRPDLILELRWRHAGRVAEEPRHMALRREAQFEGRVGERL